MLDTEINQENKGKSSVMLTISLVKEAFNRAEDIIQQDKYTSCKEIPITGCGRPILYIRNSPSNIPDWAMLFSGAVDIGKEVGKTTSVSAAFIIQTAGRFFVLTFGPAGRYLIKPDICEERFGLIVALNSVDKKSLRCIDKQTIDAIGSHTRIQSREETTADQFGLDVERDILQDIVGTSSEPLLGTRMTGKDFLSVLVKVDLSDLPCLLRAYKEKFESRAYETDYPWVTNIFEVKNPSIVNELDNRLIEKFVDANHSNLWLSIPEIISWELVNGFRYSPSRQRDRGAATDINLEGFLKTITDKRSFTIDDLKKRHVYCIDNNHQAVGRPWNIYKCAYAEIDYNGRKYILNNGKWFEINSDFLARTDLEFSKINRVSLKLPEFNEMDEGSYNQKVVAAFPSQYALMDKNTIPHGGGSGQIEFCDLFSINKEIIHIKRYGQSSVLSHLFSQGFVSGQLLQLDAEFRRKVQEKMETPFKNLIRPDSKPNEQEFSIIFGIISDSPGDKLHLPFFSRVNLNNTVKILKGFGYRVGLLKIKVDNSFANKVKLPTVKRRKIQR